MNLVKSILTNNPCYTAGRKIAVKGLMLHSVGCPQPKASVFIKNWNRSSFDSACVHGFIDANDGTVYQTLPWNHRGWHGGGSSNNTHIGVEMCEPACIKYTGGSTFTCSDTATARACAERTYNAAVELFAYLCKEYNLNPLGNGVIISHKEGHSRGIASNHGDPEHLWRGLGMGYTMDGFRNDVRNAMNGKPSVKLVDISGHYAEKHIQKLVDYKVVNGYGDGTFKPDNNITRAEFAVMIVKGLENACGYSLKSSAAFSDISGHWAEDYIKKLVACGIVNGFEDGTFKPDAEITRGQAAIMACNTLLYCGIEMKVADNYPDAIGHYAERHICSLKAYGVVNGFEDGTFKPDIQISRGQSAMYVANCLTVLGK